MTSGAGLGEPGDESAVDDGTLVVRRRAAAPELDDDLDATRVAERTGGESALTSQRFSLADGDADTGSTMIVRRESRRRAEAAARDADLDLDLTVAGTGARPVASTVAGDVPAPLGRLAQGAPPAAVVYTRRDEGPAIVERRPAAPRTPQAYVDTAAAQAVERTRARRRALAVVGIASLVVVIAVVAIVLLAFTG